MTQEVPIHQQIKIEETTSPSSSERYAHFLLADKHLRLIIDLCRKFASSSLEKVDEEKNETGTTTTLYKRAIEYIQQIATTMDLPICYRFSTEDEKMKAWLLHPEKGLTIFNISEISEEGNSLVAIKVISPARTPLGRPSFANSLMETRIRSLRKKRYN